MMLTKTSRKVWIAIGVVAILTVVAWLLATGKSTGSKNIIVGPCESSPGEGYPSCGDTVKFRVIAPKDLVSATYDGNQIILRGNLGGSPDSICVRQVTLLERPSVEKIPIIIEQVGAQNTVKIRDFHVGRCALILPTGKELS